MAGRIVPSPKNTVAPGALPPHDHLVSVSEISAPAKKEAPATSLRRAIPLATVLVLGLAFSCAVAWVVRNQERQRFEEDFDRQTQIQSRAMEVAIREYEECLFTLRDLFLSSDEVRSEEFRRTSADLRARHPGLELVLWMPRIAKEQRAAFEAAPNREDGTKFPIHENADPEKGRPPVPSPEHEEYLPVQYCDPVKGNEAMFGFDHFRGPFQRTIERAVESGETSATRRLMLNEGNGEEAGWGFTLPVYQGDPAPENAGERKNRLRGVLAGAVPFSDLLKNTVLKMPSNTVNLLLVDKAGEEGERHLAGLVDGQLRLRPSPSDDTFRTGLRREIPLPVAGRNWVASFQPSTKPASSYPAAFLTGGILLTALLAALLSSAQRGTATVQRLVDERTAELRATQRALDEDNQRRRKAEERYRAFVEQSSEAIWRLEMDEPVPVDLPEGQQMDRYYEHAILAEANDAFAHMYGFERAKEMIGMRLSELMPRDPATFEHLRRYVRGGYRLANAESHEVGRDGIRRIFLNNLTGIVENGCLVRAWGTQRDVTEQRRAEDERRRAEMRLNSAMSAADLGTWEWDVESDTLTWSAATERMFGFEPGTFRGGLADYLALVHPDHRAHIAERLRHAASEGGNLTGELKILRRDGVPRWLASRGDVIRNEQGRVIRVVGAAMDVTEQHDAAEEKERIENRLQETQKLESLGILAGGIAHDFNNLLTGILGNASLARMDTPEDSPAQHNLEAIEKISRRAAELCKQMLAYSGKGRFVVQRLDLSEIVEDTAQLIRPSLSRNATVESHLARGLPAIAADETQMRQIIMNLGINASDALGDAAGVIDIRTGLMHADADYLASTTLSPDTPPGDYVFLEISDTGCGMTPETQKKIFNPFFTTKFTGRGLGLAAVLGIVRGHGGALKVVSDVGKGSTFTLLLPSTGEPVEAPAAPEAPVPVEWRGSGAVLVIDDDEAVRIVASRMLHAMGYEVVLAVDGREGVAKFRENPANFCAILLDLTMPLMDGTEVFSELRHVKGDIKVVLMSGFNEQDAISRFAGQGLAAFVQKPFAPEELRQAFRGL